ncbi:MAG: Tn3 family transposase [Brevundimonas sp.]|nr:Tn3 family transposase [Brevundimonas sp.]MBP8072175.1 Tn3 family transposase [Brevundimonas sp.]MBP8947228.1 Tn3 family transposase [Promineifilum sp.]
MARRQLLTEEERASVFGVPTERAALARHYTLAPGDLDFLAARRGAANRLGAATWMALLRHPGFGLRHDKAPPRELIAYLADQLGLSEALFTVYGRRAKTRLEHGWDVAAHLGVRGFEAGDIAFALDRASQAAWSTNQGLPIVQAVVEGFRERGVILPASARIERIGLAGRARARKRALDAVAGAVTTEQATALDGLLVPDPTTGITPIAWLRDIADSPSARNLSGLLSRLTYVRQIGLDPAVADTVHERRFRQLVREGAVAPAFLLSDYSVRRRRATLAAQLIDLEARLSDAAVQMFDKQVGELFAKARAAQKRHNVASARDVGRLMRLFDATLDALTAAREDGIDAIEAVEQAVGWARLEEARPMVEALAASVDQDPLVGAASKYMTLRRFGPAFLEAFRFRAAGGRDGALAAVKLVQDLNRSGRRDVPADAPLPFSHSWKALVGEGENIDRRLYETAAFATLRDRLRSGDIWVDGSRSYRRFDAYLLPSAEVPAAAASLGLPATAGAYLADRARLLDWRLRRFAGALRRGAVEDVEIRGGKLRVAPLSADVPPEAARLDAIVDRLLPKVRITRLLSEVAQRTGFTDRFTELRSGKTHPNPQALLAAVLADGTNLGLERMADSSQGVTYAQLAWTQAWYLSEETYAAALACIVDAQAALPLAQVWGDGTTSSSDGQFFRSGRRGAAGAINAKYGADPGQKIYTHVSDQYAPFHSQLISATAAEAPHVLDGLLHNASSLDIHEHYTDTGGATDHVFALCHLLGYRFVPRIRDLADRRLGTFEAAGRYKELEPLIGRPINTGIIHECWDEVVRLTASLKAKTVPPSVMLKKLSAYKRQNRLDFALQELGRIERALFTLDWLESKELRRRCLAGLNKGEARHALAAAVFTQKQGRLTDRTVESQQFRASGLNLVTAAIVYWNTLYIGRAVEHLRAAGHPAPDHLLAHTAPLGWVHISLTGDYLWREPAAGADDFLALRLNERLSSLA